MIMYTSELMSADLPAPPDAQNVQYVDLFRRLTFETAAEKDAVVAYYEGAPGEDRLEAEPCGNFSHR